MNLGTTVKLTLISTSPPLILSEKTIHRSQILIFNSPSPLVDLPIDPKLPSSSASPLIHPRKLTIIIPSLFSPVLLHQEPITIYRSSSTFNQPHRELPITQDKPLEIPTINTPTQTPLFITALTPIEHHRRPITEPLTQSLIHSNHKIK
ncbi:hypothetical protein V6N12_011367 [Hibiscus sabdariffa]|uniref:Uncharacterized protein n=1 Tax=Hibiscus sabdariffa TaxID=183260 RepID=A0ABR2AB68_9ROSI